MNQLLQHQINSLQWDAHLRSQPLPVLVERSVMADADYFHSRGDYDAALNLLDRAPESGTDPYALNLSGLSKLGKKDYEEALLDFEKTQTILLQRLSKAFQNQAVTLMLMKKFVEAQKSMLRAIEIFASYPSPWVTWLSILGLTGKVEKLPEVINKMDMKWPAWRHSKEFKKYLKEDPDLKPFRSHPLFCAEIN